MGHEKGCQVLNISRFFRDGKPKPYGMCEWQVEYGISDDDPLFPVFALTFLNIEQCAILADNQKNSLSAKQMVEALLLAFVGGMGTLGFWMLLYVLFGK